MIPVVKVQGINHFIGTVIKIEKILGEYGAQFELTTKPQNEDWKHIKLWINLGKSTEKKIEEGGDLDIWQTILEKQGITADSVPQLINQLENKKFEFELRPYGFIKKERWIIKEVVE